MAVEYSEITWVLYFILEISREASIIRVFSGYTQRLCFFVIRAFLILFYLNKKFGGSEGPFSCEPEIWCALNLGRPDPQKVQESLKNPSTWLWSGNLLTVIVRHTVSSSSVKMIRSTSANRILLGRNSSPALRISPACFILCNLILATRSKVGLCIPLKFPFM